MNVLLCNRVICSEEEIYSILAFSVNNKSLVHFGALLKNANAGIKEEILKHEFTLYVAINKLSTDIRVAYLSCDEIQPYLLVWIKGISELIRWLELFPLENRASFLQKLPIETLAQWVGTRYDLQRIATVLPLNDMGQFVHRLFQSNRSPWIQKAAILGDLIELTPIEQRYHFLQQDSIQSLLPQWAPDVEVISKIAKLLPDEQANSFLQQDRILDLLSKGIKSDWELCNTIKILACEQIGPFLNRISDDRLVQYICSGLYSILRVLPEKEVLPFFQRNIVQENLAQHFNCSSNLAYLIQCLPIDYIAQFLRQENIHAGLLKWIAHPSDLCTILVVLPLDQVGPLITQRGITKPKDLMWEMNVLFAQLNNDHPDVMIECLINMPLMLQSIDNGLKIKLLLDDRCFRINHDLFFKNLIRVFQQQEKTAVGVLARMKQYEDEREVYDQFLLAYQQQLGQELDNESIKSFLQQHSLFSINKIRKDENIVTSSDHSSELTTLGD